MSVYKGDKIIAGGSVDTYFVRKPVWSQAVTITAAQINAGYTAPNDGMIIGTIDYSTYNGQIMLNDTINITRTYTAVMNAARPTNLNTLVNKGDFIKYTGQGSINTDATFIFVPFEDSTVAEPEVVTPEYIRNQNILSEWENISLPTSALAAVTMEYDGFIYGDAAATGSGVAARICIYVNGKLFRSQGNTSAYNNNEASVLVPVKKGDTVYMTGVNVITQRVAYYKLRDYTGR